MNGPDAPLRPASLVTPAFVALASATLAFFIAGGIVLPVSPGFARNELGAGDLGAGVAIGSFSVAALILRPVVGWFFLPFCLAFAPAVSGAAAERASRRASARAGKALWRVRISIRV